MTDQNPEVFRLEGDDHQIFVKIGDGLLARGCRTCRRRQEECVCWAEREAEYQAELTEKAQFVATLPRKMTKQEIYDHQQTRSYARSVFEFKKPDAVGATVYVKKGNPFILYFRTWKAGEV